MKTKALYTGSFDPITCGHLDIIKRASGLFDEIIVGVIFNANKQSLFTLDERVEMIEEATSDMKNVSVINFKGLVADYVNENGIDVVVRGLRTIADFEAEMQMAQVNAGLFKGHTQTIFLMTDPKYGYVSSSAVRELHYFNADYLGMVPENVEKKLLEKR